MTFEANVPAAGWCTTTPGHLDSAEVIQAVAETGLKPGRAAERPGLSVRQVERRVIRYREHGPGGVASGRRGRPGSRKLDEGLALRALAVIRERYADERYADFGGRWPASSFGNATAFALPRKRCGS